MKKHEIAIIQPILLPWQPKSIGVVMSPYHMSLPNMGKIKKKIAACRALTRNLYGRGGGGTIVNASSGGYNNVVLIQRYMLHLTTFEYM